MKAYELVGQIDSSREVHATLPLGTPLPEDENVRVIVLMPESESETDSVALWQSASAHSLQEVWDNDEDAAYDNL